MDNGTWRAIILRLLFNEFGTITFSVATHECYRLDDGKDYSGTVNTTNTGKTCQRWDEQFPHTHDRNDIMHFPESFLSHAENYCRNPDAMNAPWCYTIEQATRWEYCDVPKCIDLAPEECKLDSYGSTYIGRRQRTKSWRACQRWDTQSNSFTNSDFSDGSTSAAANYCRNPDNKAGGPWCFTMVAQVEWEYCDVPPCPTDCKRVFSGDDYKGNISVTISGQTCLQWDSISPALANADFVDGNVSTANNFCRNPGIPKQDVWCYTSGSEFDYCAVPFCGLYWTDDLLPTTEGTTTSPMTPIISSTTMPPTSTETTTLPARTTDAKTMPTISTDTITLPARTTDATTMPTISTETITLPAITTSATTMQTISTETTTLPSTTTTVETTMPPTSTETTTLPVTTTEATPGSPTSTETITLPAITTDARTMPPTSTIGITTPPTTTEATIWSPTIIEEATIPATSTEAATWSFTITDEATIPNTTIKAATWSSTIDEEVTIPATTAMPPHSTIKSSIPSTTTEATPSSPTSTAAAATASTPLTSAIFLLPHNNFSLSWHVWSLWSACTASCQGGVQSRFMLCQDVADSMCNQKITSNLNKTYGHKFSFQKCNNHPCPIDGSWHQWSPWQPCSSTCSSGTRQRERYCLGPFYNGNKCKGKKQQTELCLLEPCQYERSKTTMNPTPLYTEADRSVPSQTIGSMGIIIIAVICSLIVGLDLLTHGHAIR